MLEVLEFIFTNFWIWLGTVVLIVVFCTGVVAVLDRICFIVNRRRYS